MSTIALVVLVFAVGCALASFAMHTGGEIPTTAAHSDAFRRELIAADERGAAMRAELERQAHVERCGRYEQMRKDTLLAQMYPSIGGQVSIAKIQRPADRKQPVDFAIERECDYCGRKGVILLPPEKASDYDCRGCGAALAPNPLKEQTGTWQRENALLAYSQPRYYDEMFKMSWRV